MGNILTFTFVVWIVNRVEQILLQNSRKALKANEHSLGDINRVNIATSETASCCEPCLLKALLYNYTHVATQFKMHIYRCSGGVGREIL